MSKGCIIKLKFLIQKIIWKSIISKQTDINIMTTDKLTIRKLNIIEVISTYNRYLKNDFPANERKPLFVILKSIIGGFYESLGCFNEENKLVGYLFLVSFGKNYLIDYLAVEKELRGTGIGSYLLNHLTEYYKDAEAILLEVEDPEYMATKPEEETANKRIEFYYRNGYVDTKVKTITFGAHFIILQHESIIKDADTVNYLYTCIYGRSMSKKVLEKNILSFF